MDNILITGASSFLGNRLSKALLSTKTNQVHAIIREQTLETRLADGFLKSNFHTYDGTLNSLRKTIDHVQPTLIYNLSSLYMRDTSSENIEAMVESNFLFGLKLLEVLKEKDIKCSFINFGTYSQYFSEGDHYSFNMYSGLKNSFTEALNLYSEDIGLNNTNLILYDSYGPGDWRPKLLPLVRQAILQNNRISLSEPDIIIDITHIDDVVNACILAKEKQILTASENVFCVSGERYKISQLMELIEKIVGKKLALKWGEYSLPDKKIKDPWIGNKLPGWTRKIDLEEGLRSYLQ